MASSAEDGSNGKSPAPSYFEEQWTAIPEKKVLRFLRQSNKCNLAKSAGAEKHIIAFLDKPEVPRLQPTRTLNPSFHKLPQEDSLQQAISKRSSKSAGFLGPQLYRESTACVCATSQR
jgi:hypothetical protein